jgi:hypothetical protein
MFRDQLLVEGLLGLNPGNSSGLLGSDNLRVNYFPGPQKMLVYLISTLIVLINAAQDLPGQTRVILHRKFISPPDPNALGKILDPGFAKCLAYQGGKIVDSRDIASLKVDLHDWFSQQFGLNLTGAVPGAYLDSYKLKECTIYPFTNGIDRLYRQILDIKSHKATDLITDKFVLDYGFLLLLNTTGNFTGGTANGTSYNKNDLLWYTRYNYIVESEVNLTTSRRTKETVQVRSFAPGKQIVTSYGVDLLMKTQVVDERGNVGIGTIDNFIAPINGVMTQTIHTYLTWNY